MRKISRSEAGNKQRILYIFDKLLEGQLIRKSEMATKFQVSEKAIQRDIRDLRIYFDGIRELTYSRSKKGFELTDARQKQMTKEEIIAVSKILLESRAFPKKDVEAVLKKLILLSHPDFQSPIDKFIRNELHHYKQPGHGRSIFTKLWDLQQAVQNRQVVTMSYLRESDPHPVERKINPVGIMFAEYYFYLMAYLPDKDHDSPIPYRLDRIEKYRVTQEHFYMKDAERFQEGIFRERVQFMHTGKLQRIKFRFRGKSPEAIYDRLPNIREVGRDREGIIFEADVYEQGIKMWLLSQGTRVEVLEPAHFRLEIQNTIKEMLDLYT